MTGCWTALVRDRQALRAQSSSEPTRQEPPPLLPAAKDATIAALTAPVEQQAVQVQEPAGRIGQLERGADVIR
ncbi:hypothetical protein ACWCQN_37010 [Streptomyces sp. NPDC001984]